MGLYQTLRDVHDIPKDQQSLYVNAIEDLFEAGDDFKESLERWLYCGNVTNKKQTLTKVLKETREIRDRVDSAISFLDEKATEDKPKPVIANAERKSAWDRTKDNSEIDEIAVEKALDGLKPELNRIEVMEVVRRLLERGHSSSEIAGMLGVSTRSVDRWRKDVTLSKNFKPRENEHV